MEVTQKEAEPKLKTTSERMQEILKQEEPDYNAIMIEQTTSGKRPISQSAAKKFLESPRSMYEYYFGEDGKEESAVMTLGKAYEIMLLEPDKVDEEIVVAPVFNRRTRVGKEAYAEFQEKWKGKIILPEDQMEVCLKMYQRARKDQEIMAILEDIAVVQESVYFTHRQTGFRCVAKVDFRNSIDAKPFKVIDLKTFGGQPMPSDFTRQQYALKYWFQGGAYFNAYRNKYYAFPDYYWMVASTKPPYDLNYFKADQDLVREGERIWDLVLQAIKYCNDNKLWHLGPKFWRIMADHDTVRLPAYHKMR